MKASFSWIREFIDHGMSAPELVEALTMAGLEVEGLERAGEGIEGVQVAEVLSVIRHPNADRLYLCSVSTGASLYTVVCGAKNVRAGIKVPLALPGSLLPGSVRIKKALIRGEKSEGMICSESELGLTESSEGIMILDKDAPPGVDIKDYMELDDYILDISVTPNRSDCFGMLGIAREISAIGGVPLKSLLSSSLVDLVWNGLDGLSVNIVDTDICRRYDAIIIEDVKIFRSPHLIKRRLERYGIRSINNVVDITNYVMLESGQPLHAFDLDKIAGDTLNVRLSEDGESITTLDGDERKLGSGIPIIADHDGPVAIAGIIGGERTGVTSSTKRVLLECAFFDRSVVRSSSRRLGLSTESSYRFERGVDIEAIRSVVSRAASMFRENAMGRVRANCADIYPLKHTPLKIKLSVRRLNALLGTDLPANKVSDILKGLGMSLNSSGGKESFIVVPPSYRIDIVQEIDLIEEVARLVSYHKIPVTIPAASLSPVYESGVMEAYELTRDILVGLSFCEVINYSFVSKKTFLLGCKTEESALHLQNPLSGEESILRRHLFPSLLKTVRYNVSREIRDIRLFEIGNVFSQNESGPAEDGVVAGIISGARYGETWNQPDVDTDFYDIKGTLESLFDSLGIKGLSYVANHDIPFLHPGRAAKITLRGEDVGFVGEVHPKTLDISGLSQRSFVFEVSLATLIEHYTRYGTFRSIPKYPSVRRDISFVVNEGVQYGDILSFVREMDSELIEGVTLFDLYSGNNIPSGRVSLAIKIIYRDPSGTMTDEQVNRLHNRIIGGLKHNFDVEIRDSLVDNLLVS